MGRREGDRGGYYQEGVDLVDNEEVLNSQTLHLVEGVPVLTYDKSKWCGYTALSMVMQYYGYTDLTPQAIYDHIHQNDTPTTDFGNAYYTDPVSDMFLNTLTEPLHPTLQHFASVAEELSGGRLVARIVGEKDYEDLNRRRLAAGKTQVSPFYMLHAFLIGDNAPCIVRIPNHNIVITGVDEERNSYVIHNPAMTVRRVSSRENLDWNWGHKDPHITEGHPGNTNYLMLVIRERSKLQRRKLP